MMLFLAETDSSGLHTKLRVEAAGLLKAVQEPRFRFTAVMVHKILTLLDSPNKVLQDKKNRPLHWSNSGAKRVELGGEAQD